MNDFEASSSNDTGSVNIQLTREQELERRLVYNAILDKTEREKIISKYGLTDQQYTELKTELD